MSIPIKLLLIEDSQDDADLLIHHISHAGFMVQSLRVDTREALDEALKQSWDVVLGDYNMPQLAIGDAVARVQEKQHDVPFIVISGGIDDTIAASLMSLGVRDYFSKDNLVRLIPAIKRELTEKINREERHEFAERLRFQAHHDALTQLPNRSLFNERLALALMRASRHQKILAIFFIDLDHFKSINDCLGHEAGDAFLKDVSRRMTACISKSDVLSRLGGDEFLLLSEVRSMAEAEKLAQRLLAGLREPFTHEGKRVTASASIGISIYPDHGDDPHALLRHADAALYEAKHQGRNNYLVYNEKIASQKLKRQVLLNSLKRAAEGREFLPYYQPRYSPDSRQIVGMDTLLRWCIPGLAAMCPGVFLREMEENMDLLRSIDQLIWQNACGQARQWQNAGYPAMTLGLHLSPAHARMRDGVDYMEQTLREYGLQAGQVELSISAVYAAQHKAEVLSVLKQFHELGVGISLDDFGVEPVRLLDLKEFPFRSLKIHPDIVRDVPSRPEMAAIASSTIELAHRLGIKTCAKGVETDEQLALLQSMHCDEVQGYLLGSPAPAREAEHFLKPGVT